jgi:hypothetical protein
MAITVSAVVEHIGAAETKKLAFELAQAVSTAPRLSRE